MTVSDLLEQPCNKSDNVCDVPLSVHPHREAEKLAWPRWESNPRPLGYYSPMLCLLSYMVKSVRVDDISEPSLVPSISVYSMI